jgi:hypothetical protein
MGRSCPNCLTAEGLPKRALAALVMPELLTEIKWSAYLWCFVYRLVATFSRRMH